MVPQHLKIFQNPGMVSSVEQLSYNIMFVDCTDCDKQYKVQNLEAFPQNLQ